jgi:hypothetical protein
MPRPTNADIDAFIDSLDLDALSHCDTCPNPLPDNWASSRCSDCIDTEATAPTVPGCPANAVEGAS